MHMSCDMDRPERIAATTTRRIPRNGVGDPAAKGFPMNSHTDDTNDDDNLDPTADPSPTGAPRPLGYWLKAVDRLIDREFEAAFADLDATRRDWRLLNLIGGEVTDERLRAKLDARPHRLLPLLERGWVAGEPGAWTLTDAGRDALDALGERVSAIRSRVGGAVSSDDYATTLASLEAIARELGWDEADADAWRRTGRTGRRGRGPWGMRPGPGFRRFGRPPFGPGFGPGSGPAEHDDCRHPGHAHGHSHHGRDHEGRADAGHGDAAHRFAGDGRDVHVHVHLDDPRGRRHGHRGHRDHAEH